MENKKIIADSKTNIDGLELSNTTTLPPLPTSDISKLYEDIGSLKTKVENFEKKKFFELNLINSGVAIVFISLIG